MIDYEKLKLAHELATKIKNFHVVVRTNFIFPGDKDRSTFACYFLDIVRQPPEHPAIEEGKFSDLDDLIAKLRELTQSDPKYKVGDEVWAEVNKKYLSMQIEEVKIRVNSQSQWYRTNIGFCAEEHLYPSKQTLIEAQIKYWQNLQSDIQSNQSEVDIDSCQHESDDLMHLYTTGPINKYVVQKFKCKKCGEFYK